MDKCLQISVQKAASSQSVQSWNLSSEYRLLTLIGEILLRYGQVAALMEYVEIELDRMDMYSKLSRRVPIRCERGIQSVKALENLGYVPITLGIPTYDEIPHSHIKSKHALSMKKHPNLVGDCCCKEIDTTGREEQQVFQALQVLLA